MHRALLLLPTALLLVPTEAFACINSMYRTFTDQIATQPLEYLHFGIFAAAAVLLLFRGQPRKDDMWDPADVLGDDAPMSQAARPKRGILRPSLVRQVAILVVAVLGSFGIGMIAADAMAFSDTLLTHRAMWALGFAALGLSISLFRTGSMFLVLVRKALLLIALVMAFNGAQSVWNSEVTYEKNVGPFYMDPEIAEQVEF